MFKGSRCVSYFSKIWIFSIIGVSSLITANTEIWWMEKTVFLFLSSAILLSAPILYLKLSQGYRLTFGLTDLMLLLFYSYAFLSTIILNNGNIGDSIIYTFFGYFICYLAFRVSLSDKTMLNSFLQCLFYIIISNCLYGILQYAGLFPTNSPFFRITGTFYNPGIYAGFIALGIPIGLWRLRSGYHSKLIFSFNLFCLILITAAIILSKSRAALLAASVGAGTFACFFYADKIPVFPKKIKLLFIFSILFLGAFSLIFLNSNSVIGRILVWKVSIKMLTEHPVFGIGYGQFPIKYGYEQAAFFETKNSFFDFRQVAGMSYYVFNELFRIILENGIVGFLAFMFLLFKVFSKLAKLALKDKNPLLIVLFCIIVILLVFAQFSYPFDNIAIFLVLLAIFSIVANYDKQYSLEKSPKLKPLLLIFVMMSMGTLFIFSLRKLNAINSWQSAQKYLAFKEQDAWNSYKSIYPVLSNNGTFLFNYGAELVVSRKYKKAVIILNEAKKYGNNVEMHLFLGDAYLGTGNLTLAEKEYKLANNMVPNLFLPLEKLLELYLFANKPKNVFFIVNKIINQKVKIPSPEVSRIKERARLLERNEK